MSTNTDTNTRTLRITDIDPADLYSGCLSVTPVTRDWSEGYGDTWESFEAPTCETCGETCRHLDGPDALDALGIDPDALEDGHPADADDCAVVESIGDESWEAWRCVSTTCERRGEQADDTGDGPMMSYYYPLPDGFRNWGEHPFPRDEYAAADALRDVPLCVVRIDGDGYGLALTGGGMDLSWEIAEAFALLGYLPPVHFADLPGMAGKFPTPAEPLPMPRPENVARFPLLVGSSVVEIERHNRMVDWAHETCAHSAAVVAVCRAAVEQHAESADDRRVRVLNNLDRISA